MTTGVNKSENKRDLEVKNLTVLQNLKKNLSPACKFMLLNIIMHIHGGTNEDTLWSRHFHSTPLLCQVTNFHKIHTYLW